MIVVLNDQLVSICGSTSTAIFKDIIDSLLQYTCGIVKILWDVKDALRCSTWVPLYYNTVYSAMCYNGTTGVWAIAATQFMTTLMTCIILTFRCVFFDLEILEDTCHEDAMVVHEVDNTNDKDGENEDDGAGKDDEK
jgi:hypothetical protein